MDKQGEDESTVLALRGHSTGEGIYGNEDVVRDHTPHVTAIMSPTLVNWTPQLP
jgi:hypothetical protein